MITLPDLGVAADTGPDADQLRDVVIVGAGPAGYTAAIYTARANLRPLVVEGAPYGGALMNTTEVENFPGFIDGIIGPDLMANLRKQAEHFGAEVSTDDATYLQLDGEIKEVRVGEVTYRARAVILATGSAYRQLDVPGEKRLSGHGVSWCATCDGFFFRDQHIAVVGGGDSALEEATFLSRFAASVTVIHRRDTLRASKIMQQRALANPKRCAQHPHQPQRCVRLWRPRRPHRPAGDAEHYLAATTPTHRKAALS